MYLGHYRRRKQPASDLYDESSDHDWLYQLDDEFYEQHVPDPDHHQFRIGAVHQEEAQR